MPDQPREEAASQPRWLVPVLEFFDEVYRWIDWFVPAELRKDPEQYRKARLIIITSLTLALAMYAIFPMRVVGTHMTAEEGRWSTQAIWGQLAGITSLLGIAVLIRGGRSVTLPGMLLPLALLAMLGWIAYFDNGFSSPALIALPAVPIVSAFAAGPRMTAICTGLGVLELGIFYLLDAAGHDFPQVFTSRTHPFTLRMMMLVWMIVFFGIFAWYYERIRQSQMETIASALQDLQATNRALLLSEERFRQIADNIDSVIWLGVAGSRRLLYVNRAYDAIFGPRTAPSTDSDAWLDAVHREDRDRVVAGNPFGPASRPLTYRISRPDGSIRWLHHSVFPVDGDDEQRGRVVGIATDITEQQEAQQLRQRFLEAVIDVQEKERQHLARELHDETGQSLTALLVGLRALEDTLDQAQHREFVSQLRNALREVVGEIGRLARGLHPAMLGELGLAAATGHLAHEASEAHGVTVEVDTVGFEDRPRLEPMIELTLYRIIQEALTNVARHAKAKRVEIEIERLEDRVRLRVQDDGQGFAIDPNKKLQPRKDPDRKGSSGLGLLSMRERAGLLGGTTEIRSTPGQGTIVFAEVPVPPPSSVRRTD